MSEQLRCLSKVTELFSSDFTYYFAFETAALVFLERALRMQFSFQKAPRNAGKAIYITSAAFLKALKKGCGVYQTSRSSFHPILPPFLLTSCTVASRHWGRALH
jgi:hypothetical protein